jgi:predicted nucleic acid-binding Zn finger protein
MPLDYREVPEAVSKMLLEPPEKALEAVLERRVVRLRCRGDEERVELYVFHGRDRDYLIFPRRFCTCKDFELNVVVRRAKGTCYHLVAYELAVARNSLRDVEVGCETLFDIALEVLLTQRSPTLQRLLFEKVD